MMDIFDLDGQTAPESTRGLFDPPEAKNWSAEKRHSSTLELSAALCGGGGKDGSMTDEDPIHPRSKSASFTSSKLHQHRSALHTVNEESDIGSNNNNSSNSLSYSANNKQRLMDSSSLQRKHRSSAIFNNFPMGNVSSSRHQSMIVDDDDDDDDESAYGLSRADALAEAEAKLIGAYGNNAAHHHQQQHHAVTAPGGNQHHRLSQQSRRHSSQQPLGLGGGAPSSSSDGYGNNNDHRRSSRTGGYSSEELYGLRQQQPDQFLQRQKNLPPVNKFDQQQQQQQQQEKHNRRLSEPNARGYYRDPDHYDFQQRRSLNNYNKRTSLQWPPPRYDDQGSSSVAGGSSGNEYDLDYRRQSASAAATSGNKPAGLTLDTSRSSRRSSRNYGADWRASTSSLLSNSARSPTTTTTTPATSASNRSSYNWVPFTPTRFSFPREDTLTSSSGSASSQQQQRRALFVAHLPFSALVPLLKSHQLVSGILRVNKRNRSDAYVFCEEFNADIYICGSRDRNRALEGDVVAVKLVDVDKVIREKQEKEQAKVIRNNGQPIVRKPDEEDEKEIMFGGEEDVDKVKPKYCGVVVAILERAQNQAFSGTLGLTRPSNRRASTIITMKKDGTTPMSHHNHHDDGDDDHTSTTTITTPSGTPRIVWFKPTDKRVPLIAIPVEQAPQGFIESSQQFENRLFLGSIKRWPITSLHPFGVLENELGHVDDLSIQFRAILADNNFAIDPFSETIMRTLPPIPWTVPDEARSSRLDWRSIRSFTIDTSGDGVLDNALSIKRKSDSVFEVGFHVADVSAFVKPHSPLDKEAKARATSVYLYESAPLWPEQLLHECTNLVPGQDRLAFSVVGKIDQSGKVHDIWYGRTIIRSHGTLTVNQLQDILDGVGVPEHITIEDQKKPEWEDDVNNLYSLAQNMKQARRRNGALFLSEPALDISIDGQGNPTGISLKQRLPADDIMDELKILVNTSVAQKISSHFPDHALLQCQSMPNERKLRELAGYLRGLGYSIDPSTASSLQQTVDAIENEAAKTVITTLALKTMHSSKFFCTGKFDINRYHHYALNTPLYTQFTSPSRRYADLIVHRQLDAALTGEKRFYLECEVIQKIARHCNVKGQAGEYACEQSQHLFMSRYLSMSRQTATTHEAIVVGVQEQAFDVIVPGLILERRIHVINLPLETFKYSPADGVLHLFWRRGVPTADAMVEHADAEEDDDNITTTSHEEAAAAATNTTTTTTTSTNAPTNTGENGSSSSPTASTSAPPSTMDNAISEAVHQLSIKSAPPSATEHNGSSSAGSGSHFQQQQQQQHHHHHQEHNGNPSSSTISNKKRPRSMSLRVVEGENPWTSQQECTIPNESRQVIRPFDYIRVVITSDPDRSPPLIRVLAANPFV